MLKFEMLEWSECRPQLYSKYYPVTINKVCLISSKTKSMLGMQFYGKSLWGHQPPYEAHARETRKGSTQAKNNENILDSHDTLALIRTQHAIAKRQ